MITCDIKYSHLKDKTYRCLKRLNLTKGLNKSKFLQVNNLLVKSKLTKCKLLHVTTLSMKSTAGV